MILMTFASSKGNLECFVSFNDFLCLKMIEDISFNDFCLFQNISKTFYFNDFDISMILYFICFEDFVSTRIILQYFICFNNFISFPINLRHLIFSMIFCLLEQFWDITLFHWFCFFQNNLDIFSEPLCLFQWFYMFQNNFSCLNIIGVLMILCLLE